MSGRVAAVALPFVDHPRLGLCLVVTERSTINGHTGGPMMHAGEVVLFGGSTEPGESAPAAALRELCEESGTLDHLHDPEYEVGHYVGQWVTESGFTVEGHVVRLPADFVDQATPDPREVARIGYLPWAAIVSAPRGLEYHPVRASDRQDGIDGDVGFESPTIRVTHPDTGEEWVLWGVAGHMVTCLAEMDSPDGGTSSKHDGGAAGRAVGGDRGARCGAAGVSWGEGRGSAGGS